MPGGMMPGVAEEQGDSHENKWERMPSGIGLPPDVQ